METTREPRNKHQMSLSAHNTDTFGYNILSYDLVQLNNEMIIEMLK